MTATRHRAVATALVALLAACSGEAAEPAPPAATLPTEPGDTATATEPATESTQTTDETDGDQGTALGKREVQDVMDDLDRQFAAMARTAARSKQLNEQFVAYLGAIYAKPAFRPQFDAWRELRGDLRGRPGAPRTQVRKILERSRECVYFTADRSFDEVFTRDLTLVQPSYLALGPNKRPNRRNPTDWQLYLDTAYPNDDPPEDVCT
ncbi:MAG: hypothetical protein ACRDU8_08185 [Egibacteraceae bacterium]